MERTRDVHQKALEINLNTGKYGTIAEIGAGQETARWFFRVGGAAGTIAKAMSAYDMQVSDAIYGKAPRYVSRERLVQMLEHEYRLVIERLDAERGASSTFFAFANTVAARSYTRKTDGQGWVGIRFQPAPRAQPSQIDVHVSLKGAKATDDQETLGILGVNLIYAALHFSADPDLLLESLMDGLYPEQIEIDMIDFDGPAFAQVDNRAMALRLVQLCMTPAAMFTANGEVVHVADALYKKAVLVERSRFRPPTHLTLNMLECAQRQFCAEREVDEKSVMVLSEMTLHNLADGGDVHVQDFIDRAELLCGLGKNVLISNLGEYHRLAAYLFRYTSLPVGLVLGVPTLAAVFDEKYYEDLPGGILEAFGRLFKNDLRLYVCPARGASGLGTVKNFEPAAHLRHLYAHLLENRLIRPLQGVQEDYLDIFSHEVLEKMRAGNPEWETCCPPQVVSIIREKALFGCV